MEYEHEPLSIVISEVDEWPKKPRGNSFFEIVHIMEGRGEQLVNYKGCPYEKDSVFLLPASNCHEYKIAERTRFRFLRFTSNYFQKQDNSLIDYSMWYNRLNYIIGNYNRLPGELIPDVEERKKVITLMEMLQVEFKNRDSHSPLVMQSSLVSILGIIARSLEGKCTRAAKESHDDKFREMLHYIQYNLFAEDKTKVKHVADHFQIAETYFSEYFRRNAGEGFQEYVIKSKLRVAEARVLYTRQSFKEIAYELGFTDSSHLNRMMKKHHQRGLKSIRISM